MNTDIFRETRERVSAQEAARRYGMSFDRRGWCLCSFHGDKHPSMSFKGQSFHCWSCGEHGSAIDFVMKLYGLDALGAVTRLNEDFNLCLPLHRQPTETELEAARNRAKLSKSYVEFERWRETFTNRLIYAAREGHIALRNLSDLDRLTEREVLAVRRRVWFEYLADILAHGTAEEQFQIYRERGSIEAWINRILSDTPQNTSAA